MYHAFYQLKENPFNVTADPDFFYSNKGHCEALSHLHYGIEQRRGILVVTGEVGTGKTTLCKTLLKQSRPAVKFALILNPNFSEIQLLRMIVKDFAIPTNEKNKFALMDSLNTFLIEESNKGHNIVLIIDEAQNLSIKQLEQIRLLSNLETEKEKLLQIILIGQPELNKKLQVVALRQLRQRISVFFHLEPLEKEDIKNYIQHRISRARIITGLKPQPIIFNDAAIDSIYHYTKGSPRTINVLCDRAMLAGFVAETHTIDDMTIENCAKEVLYCEHNL